MVGGVKEAVIAVHIVLGLIELNHFAALPQDPLRPLDRRDGLLIGVFSEGRVSEVNSHSSVIALLDEAIQDIHRSFECLDLRRLESSNAG